MHIQTIIQCTMSSLIVPVPQPGDFVHTLGDAHVYLNHIEPLKIQVSMTYTLCPQGWENPYNIIQWNPA